MAARLTTKIRIVTAFLLLAVAAVAAPAQVLTTDFRTDAGGWKAVGAMAKVVQAIDATTGAGTLTLDYAAGASHMNGLILPFAPNALGAARSLHFSLKADHATTIIASLQEKDGGDYTAVFSVPAGKWQEVALNLSDFLLSERASDPKDPNGKLDREQIQFLMLGDLGQLMDQADTAPRRLVMGAFTARAEPQPEATFTTPGDPRLDTFAAPQAGWSSLTATGLDLSVESDVSLPGRGLKMVYRQTPGKFVAVLRPIPRGQLAGQGALLLHLSSVQPTTLMIRLRARGSGSYSAMLDVAGRRTPADPAVGKDYRIPFAQFEREGKAGDKDTSGSLELSQVYEILIADMSGLLAKEAGAAVGDGAKGAENILRIGDLRAVPAP